MLSQTFCCWDKQQSAESNIIQLHLTLKCTKDQSSRFCDCFLVSKWVFKHYDHCLTNFHAGSEQLLVCVVINNSSYPPVKNNSTACHAFGKHWMQARGFLNYRLKILLAESYLLHMSRVVRWPVFHRPCWYFTANLAEAGILNISVWSRYCETNNLP